MSDANSDAELLAVDTENDVDVANVGPKSRVTDLVSDVNTDEEVAVLVVLNSWKVQIMELKKNHI